MALARRLNAGISLVRDPSLSFPGLEKVGLNSSRRYASKTLEQSILVFVRFSASTLPLHLDPRRRLFRKRQADLRVGVE